MYQVSSRVQSVVGEGRGMVRGVGGKIWTEILNLDLYQDFIPPPPPE